MVGSPGPYRLLKVDVGHLSIETAPTLDLGVLRTLVGGGYFDMPLAYESTEDVWITLVTVANGRERQLLPNVFVPELLQVIAGPALIVGFRYDSSCRSLTERECERFRVVQIHGTSVPRLVYVKP